MAYIGSCTVNVEGGFVIEGNAVLPIVEYLDEDGDECRPEDAVSVIAGAPGYFIHADILEEGNPTWAPS